MRKSIFCVFVLAVLPWAFVHESRAAQANPRAAERDARKKLRKSTSEAEAKIANAYLDLLAADCQTLIKLKAKNEADTIASQIENLDAQYSKLAALKDGIEQLADDKPLNDLKENEHASRLKAASKAYASSLVELAQSTYRGGLYLDAYDWLRKAVDSDPDNQIAEKALGRVKASDGWYDSFEATMRLKGNTYVPKIGWVQSGISKRVEEGEWQEGGVWMSMSQADKLHANAASSWVVETQNFVIYSTETREQTIQLAERLEELRKVCYRNFIDFFIRGVSPPGMLQFAVTPARKLPVYWLAQRKDYESAVQQTRNAFKARLLQASGFYDPASHASFFNADAKEPALTRELQREVARQILLEHAFKGNAGPPPWISEGVGEVFEYTALDDDGNLSIPTGKFHQDVSDAAQLLKDKKLSNLSELALCSDREFFDSPSAAANIKTAGAFCVYMLDRDDGLYAHDFQEYLYDRCQSAKPGPLMDYFGFDMADLEQALTEYLKKIQAEEN